MHMYECEPIIMWIYIVNIFFELSIIVDNKVTRSFYYVYSVSFQK